MHLKLKMLKWTKADIIRGNILVRDDAKCGANYYGFVLKSADDFFDFASSRTKMFPLDIIINKRKLNEV